MTRTREGVGSQTMRPTFIARAGDLPGPIGDDRRVAFVSQAMADAQGGIRLGASIRPDQPHHRTQRRIDDVKASRGIGRMIGELQGRKHHTHRGVVHNGTAALGAGGDPQPVQQENQMRGRRVAA